MKKITLALVMILSLMGEAKAQIGTDFGVNMFASLKGGFSCYNNLINDSQDTWGFSGGISVGKWILNPLAFRVSFDMMTVPNGIGVSKSTANYALMSAEFLWDLQATFSRIRNNFRWSFYPMIGLGMSFREAVDNYATNREFQAMLGLQINYHITRGWDAFIEGKCNFFAERYDGKTPGGVYLASYLIGFTRQFTETPFRRRTEHESRGPMEDWFFGVGIGPNFSSYTFEHIDEIGMYGVAPEIMFGRNFSNFWTIRFELTGLTGHQPFDTIAGEPGESFKFGMLHTDVMLNLTHAFKFTRGRALNVLPYLGAGIAWRLEEPLFDIGADFGVMFRYYISRKSDLYVDVKYLMVPPRVPHGIGPEGPLPGLFGYNVVWVGLPSITLGYIYNFGTNTTRYRLKAHWWPKGSCGDLE